MKIIYENNIVSLGNSVGEFGNDMVILFGDNAPDELKDYCYIIKLKELEGNVKPGDFIELNGVKTKIIALGDEVINNINNLGHVTINLSGNTDDVLPGSVVTENVEFPPLQIGSTIRIIEGR